MLKSLKSTLKQIFVLTALFSLWIWIISHQTKAVKTHLQHESNLAQDLDAALKLPQTSLEPNNQLFTIPNAKRNTSVVAEISPKHENSSRLPPHERLSNENSNIFILTYGFWWMRHEEKLRQKQGRIKNCEYSNCFLFTTDNYLPLAHVILYDAWSHLVPPSDVCSSNSSLRIFYTLEAPIRQAAHNWERFNDCFHLTATYHKTADIYCPYGQVKSVSHVSEKIPKLEKPKLVAWIVSHCSVPSGRDRYVKELQKYLQVDIYGECADSTVSDIHSTMRLLQSSHYFYLAFENSLCAEYITEKTWRTLDYNIVPVIMAGHNSTHILPPHSFIDVYNFKTPKDLAAYLKNVAKNHTLYNSFFKWKDSQTVRQPDILCETCAFANKHMDMVANPSKLPLINNIEERWSQKFCEKPPW